MLIAFILYLLGSIVTWSNYVEYSELYKEFKPQFPDCSIDEFCSLLSMEQYKNILFWAFILWIISPQLVFISVGSLATFLVLNIPSIKRAINV